MRTDILIIFFVSLMNFCFGQFDDAHFEEKMAMEKSKNDYSWAYKNVFLEHKLTGPGTEIMFRNRRHIYYRQDEYNPSQIDTLRFTDDRIPVTILGYALESRLNLVNGKNNSLHIKFPINLSFNIMGEEWGENYHLTRGFFQLSVPVLIGYSRGLNSTFSNCQKKGVSISAGFQYLRSPLLGGKVEEHSSGFGNDVYTGIEDAPTFKNWVTPLVQIDYYFLTRNKKIHGVSLAANPYKDIYIKFAYIFIATKK